MPQESSSPGLASPIILQTPFDENDKPTIALPPPVSGKTHQRSRTNELPPLFQRTPAASPTRASALLPFLRTSSRPASPERVSVSEAAEFDVDSASHISSSRTRSGRAVDKLASWFEGTSDPVNITLVPSPKKERSDPLYQPDEMDQIFGSTDSLDTLTRRPPKKVNGLGTASMNQSRFSFFRKTSQALQDSNTTDRDELAQLDIRDTLFPQGPTDEYSPASFKNLQLNAEGTLRRFQNAYVDQQKAIRSLTSVKNIQKDELEASQTQNEHLKLQLVEVTDKAAEQERLILSLRAQLSELSSFPHSTETQHKSIRMVSQSSASSGASIGTVSTKHRKNRFSDGSTSADSEMGSDMSSAVSVFSDAMSLTENSPGTSVAASPVMKPTTLRNEIVYDQPRSSERVETVFVAECQNCHGVKTSEAWDVVTMMKLENTVLKDRIAELENANNSALDLLSGLNLL